MHFNQAKQGLNEVNNNEDINKGHSRMFLSGIFDARCCSYEIGKSLFNKQPLRGRSPITGLGDDSLYIYERQTARGFTLIELLVVVLIIGILAAVALPQYQQAVLKSRYSTVMNNVKTIVDALEVYYLANGEYPNDDVSGLDIEISGCTIVSGGQFICSNATYDYWAGNPIVGGFLNNKQGLAYLQYPIHDPTKPGVRECWADSSNPVANNVCKSLGGTVNGTDDWRINAIYEHSTAVWNVYTLP